MDSREQWLERSHAALGLSNMVFFVPVGIARRRWQKPASASRWPIMVWPPSSSFPAGLYAILCLCTLPFQTGSSLLLQQHRGGLPTAALAIPAAAPYARSRFLGRGKAQRLTCVAVRRTWPPALPFLCHPLGQPAWLF